MNKTHAKLSPSGAARWMNCPGSVAAEAAMPDTGKASEYAAEGTAAHEVAELCLTSGNDAKDYNGRVAFIDGFEIPNDPEMQRHVQSYVDYVRDQDGHLLVEQQVSFGGWVLGGYGTADAIVIKYGTMSVIDLKYGRGVQVDAESNPQGMCYALGALSEYGFTHTSMKTAPVDSEFRKMASSGNPTASLTVGSLSNECAATTVFTSLTF